MKEDMANDVKTIKDIAVINTNIGFIVKDIAEIKLSLRDTYATRENLIQFAKETDLRLVKLENASNLWRWLSPMLGVISGSIITFLLLSYIQKA